MSDLINSVSKLLDEPQSRSSDNPYNALPTYPPDDSKYAFQSSSLDNTSSMPSNNLHPLLPSSSASTLDPITRSHLEFYEKEVTHLRSEVTMLRNKLEEIREREVKKLESAISDRTVGRGLIGFGLACVTTVMLILYMIPKDKW